MGSFSYSHVVDGEVKRIELPYDPTIIGFFVRPRSSCCLYFKKDDYLLRINTGSHMILLYEEINGVRSRNLLSPACRANDQNEFNEKLSKWLTS